MARRCEVREMRSAVAAWAIVRGDSEKATGELIDTETVTISSKEGRWKRAARYLAGSLSYRTSGAQRGREETCRKVTRLAPTQLESGFFFFFSSISSVCRLCPRRHPRIQVPHTAGLFLPAPVWMSSPCSGCGRHWHCGDDHTSLPL
jgi:hypothetical protein